MAFLTKAELAGELGVTRPRIYQLIKMGLPVRADGKLDRDKSIEWVASNIRPHEKPEAGEEGFSDARRRKEIALANLREHELSVKRGTVVLVEDVEICVVRMVAIIRNAFLALPTKTAPVLVGLPAPKIFEVLTEEVRQILTNLSETKRRSNGKRV